MGDCFKFLWPFQNVRTLTINLQKINLYTANIVSNNNLFVKVEKLKQRKSVTENVEWGTTK